jgi:small subunit ribosomal protein S20
LSKNRQTMKRNRQSEELRNKNRAFKSRIRTTLRAFEEETEPEKKREIYNRVISLYDKAGQKNIFHPRTVARRISGLTRQLNSFTAEKTKTSTEEA